MEHYGFLEDELFLMTEKKEADHLPILRFIERQLRQLRDVYRNLDLLLVGFWGHGLLTKNGKRYLCATDTDMDQVESTGISFDLLWDYLTAAGPQNMCLILDCCQNHTTGRGSMETFQEAEIDSLSRGMAQAARDVLAKKRANGESVTIPPTYAVMNSCSSGERAYEWNEQRHGVFTAHLLEGMNQGLSSIGQLARHVAERVPRTSQRVLYKIQTPFFKLEGSGDIPLELNKSAPKPSQEKTVDRAPVTDDNPSLADEAERIYRRLKAEEERKEQLVRAEQIARERLAAEKAERERLAEQERLAKENAEFRRRGIGTASGDRVTVRFKGMEYAFRWCPPGTFMMGSPGSEEGRSGDERQHKVTLTKGYWMQETPVTQAMWESVMGNNPSKFKGANNPVECVSWNDCQEYIEKLNTLSQDMKFRLPSEAEWEYACRAGRTTAYGGTGILEEMGWYEGNSGDKTHAVGQKDPNGWGIYDMHGNVWEWCNDWYGEYPTNMETDPKGPGSGSYRVNRGGSWYYLACYCRSAFRYWDDPGLRNYRLGFRLAFSSASR